MNKKTIWKIVFGLSGFGIILALYLLFEQITNSPFRPCSINTTINCDAIISGLVSKTLGIPTPVIGLGGYIIILISSIFQKKKLLLGMSGFGLLFCLWIAYQELFILHTICPVCILCQLTMIGIFTLAIILQKGGK